MAAAQRSPGRRDRRCNRNVLAIARRSWLISHHRTDAVQSIACIVDDKFIIGEVKESTRKINERLADRLTTVANLVRPDIVILACSDPEAANTVAQLTQRMQDKIKDVGIRAIPLTRDPRDAGLPAIIAGKRLNGVIKYG